MAKMIGYDYYGQSGDYYNEIYTYDKAWNDSSKEDPQIITGINTNNYWIRKYGADFCEYRGIGYKDDKWRNPNQKGAGPSFPPVGDPDSTPNDYTNGSHIRFHYVGNRFAFGCAHCLYSRNGFIPSQMPEDGRIVFVKADGSTASYAIENWISRTDAANPDDSSIYWREDGRTLGGPNNGGETGDWKTWAGDSFLIRFETDPEDDGIPPMKKWAFSPTKGNKLFHTGMGTFLPIYQNINPSNFLSIGPPYGGIGPAYTWSGDSGSLVWTLDHATSKWYPQTVAGAFEFDVIINKVKEWTGDEEYEIVELTEPDYYILERDDVNPIYGLTGGTFGARVTSGELSAVVIATTDSTVEVVESNKLSLNIDSGDLGGLEPPRILVDEILVHEGSVAGRTLSYNIDPEFENIISINVKKPNNTENNQNETVDFGTIEHYETEKQILITLQDGTEVAGQYTTDGQKNVYAFDSYAVAFTGGFLNSYIGQTASIQFNVFNVLGSDSKEGTFYIRGWSSATMPNGLTYNRELNRLETVLSPGALLESGVISPYLFDHTVSWPPYHYLEDTTIRQNYSLQQTTPTDLSLFDGVTFTANVYVRLPPDTSFPHNDAMANYRDIIPYDFDNGVTFNFL